MNQQNMYGEKTLPSMLKNWTLTGFDLSCRILLPEVVGGQSGSDYSVPVTAGCSQCKMGFVPSEPTACSTFQRAGSLAGSSVNKAFIARHITRLFICGPKHRLNTWAAEHWNKQQEGRAEVLKIYVASCGGQRRVRRIYHNMLYQVAACI